MLSRSRSRIAALALLIAIAAVYWFSRNDEAARARAPIEHLLEVVAFDERRGPASERGQRILRAFEASTTPDVTASIPEAPGVLRGRAALAAFATEAGDLHRLELGVHDVMPSFDAGKQTALVTMRVTIAAFSRGYEHREVRNASVQLVRRGDAWSIGSLTVAPRTHEEPEARP